MHHLILKQLVSCGESRPGSPNLLLGPGSLDLSVKKKGHSHKTLDFAPLIVCPESVQNLSRTYLMTIQFSVLAFAKRTKSSAKKRCEKEGPLLEAFTGFHRPSSHFSWINRPRYSMHMMNMYRNRGSPCLIPLVGENDSKLPPLKRMEVVTVVMQLMIISMRLLGKLNMLNMFFIKLHSSLS